MNNVYQQNLQKWRGCIKNFTVNQTNQLKKVGEYKDVLDIGVGGSMGITKGLFPERKMLDFRQAPHTDILLDIEKGHTEQKWDIIYCLEVLEHTHRPWIVAENLTKMLKDGGYLFITVPSLGIAPHGHPTAYPDLYRFLPKYAASMFSSLKAIVNVPFKNNGVLIGIADLMKK